MAHDASLCNAMVCLQVNKPAAFTVDFNGAQGKLDARVVSPSGAEDEAIVQEVDKGTTYKIENTAKLNNSSNRRKFKNAMNCKCVVLFLLFHSPFLLLLS